MGDGDDHVLALDQVLVLEVGPPSTISVRRGVANSSLIAVSSSLTIVLDARARAQDVEIVGDLGGELLQLLGDLVAAERGQALQAQLEDGARLLVREPVGAVLGDRGGADRRSARSAARCPAPASRAPSAPRAPSRVRRGADQRDHLVDIGDRDREADQDMRALARLVQQELGAAGDDLLAEVDEGLRMSLSVMQLRPAAVQRHHVGAEDVCSGVKR